MANSETYREIIERVKVVEQTPGVYLFFDASGTVIYVGKAKKLRNRLLSYFRSDVYGKTKVLQRKITRFETVKVQTEADALLLENSLIKKHQPRYNILLKDDKTYPWICIKNERFPRVFSTRTVYKDGSKYFGPYANAKMVNTLLELLRNLFPLRSCKFQLSEENIEKGKFKVCLDYHIKKCLGACEGLQSEVEYMQDIQQIKDILSGNTHQVLDFITEKMHQFSDALDFERAQLWKEKLLLLERFQQKSMVVHPSVRHADIFTIQTETASSFVNFLSVKNGSIVQSFTAEIKHALEEEPEDILKQVIVEWRQKFDLSAPVIVTNIGLEIEGMHTEFVLPQKGDKKTLVDLSLKNVLFYKGEKWKQLQKLDPRRHVDRLLKTMQKDLRLPTEPQHIECFDNSNFHGEEAVSACVVFKDGKPSKSEYRHFLVKTVVGPNDFATMTEVVHRRYKRLKEEGSPLPQLIVIDGGKGQLSASVEALKALDLHKEIAIVGIAKKLEEIFYPGDSIPLYLDKRSETLKVLQHLRNEAHRFGITHHRKRRVQARLTSELDTIEGIGEKTVQKLLFRFGSVERVTQQTQASLAECIGNSKATIVHQWIANRTK